ncbi:MAG: SPOR domain-containing protein, partial [Planctomycetes bacterium]|nr:SPOR domain-containing protein [Planctomycetota bacterium]
ETVLPPRWTKKLQAALNDATPTERAAPKNLPRSAPRHSIPSRLPELPEVEASRAAAPIGAPQPARFWTWFNEVVEVRRVTIGVFGAGVVLAVWIGYRTGAQHGQEQGLARVEIEEPAIIATIDPAPDGTRRAPLRGGSAGNQAAATKEETRKDAGAERRTGSKFGVQVAETPSLTGAQELQRYLNEREVQLGATAGIVKTSSSRYRVIIGACGSEEEATGLLESVKALKSFKGTNFNGAVITKY